MRVQRLIGSVSGGVERAAALFDRTFKDATSPMTPRPAAPDVAHSGQLARTRPVSADLLAVATAQVLDPRVWTRTRLLVDLLMLTLASSAALFAAPELVTTSNRLLAAAFPLVAVVLMHARHRSDERLHPSILDTATGVIGAVSSAAVVTLAAASVVGASHPVGLALRLWLFAVVYAGLARIVLVSLRSHAAARDAAAVPTLIVGAGAVGELLVKRISEDPRYGMRPVAFLDADPLPMAESSAATSIPVLGDSTDLDAAIRQTGARRVILAFSSEPDRVLVDRVAECRRLGVDVLLVPRLFESINGRVTIDHVGEVPVLALQPTDPRSWEFDVKHALDRIVALVAVLALAPALAIIALLVRFTSSGPILFRQQRIGRDGREFTMLKFRTMRGDPSVLGEADAGWAAEATGETPPPAVATGPRVTRVGLLLRKSSLDELPQLFNVLWGDMSFVGPRPERVSYVEGFERVIYRYTDRHRVKSGLTGLAQVNGLRGETSIADRVKWDNHYIQNWSLRMDLRIIALTVAELLRFRG